MYETVSTVILVIFVVILMLGLIRLGKRFIDFWLAAMRPPLLAIRDLVFLTGLAFPFAAILLVRATGQVGAIQGQIWWALFTGIPALIGVTTFVAFEYLVIEKARDEEVLKYLRSVDAQEDREFGIKRRELEEQHLEDASEDE